MSWSKRAYGEDSSRPGNNVGREKGKMEDDLSWAITSGAGEVGETFESLKDTLRRKQRKKLTLSCSSPAEIPWVVILALEGLVDGVETLEVWICEHCCGGLCYAPLLWPSLKALYVHSYARPMPRLQIHESWFTGLCELALGGVRVCAEEFGGYLRSPSVKLEHLTLAKTPDLVLDDFLLYNTSLRTLNVDAAIDPLRFGVGLAKNTTLRSLVIWECNESVLWYIGLMLGANRSLTRFVHEKGKTPPSIEAVVKRNRATLEAACKLLVWTRALGGFV